VLNNQNELFEDNDIKIAGVSDKKVLDDGEIAAMEFNEQKQNGNIEKAYTLGKRLSEIIFTTDDILAAHCCKKYAVNETIRSNAQVLFAFIVDTVLEHGCPNSITAQTALNYFHEQVREKSPESYNAIVESGAFSLYLLCSRDDKVSQSSCIGDAFADSCDMEEDKAVVKIGDDLYNIYFNICSTELKNVNFIK